MTQGQTSSANQTAKAHFGSVVRDKENKRYLRVSKFADRTGRVGKETGVNYVILTDAQFPENKPVILHPAKAAELFNARKVDTMLLLTGKRAADVEQLLANPSKKIQAIKIFDEACTLGQTRQDVLKRFREEVGMTEAGAENYYNRCRTSQWD